MLKALADRVIIKRSEEQRVSAGGIVLQRDISEQVFAEALDVGPDVKSDIKVGDRLAVDWRQVGVINYDDSKYFVVKEQDIMAVVE